MLVIRMQRTGRKGHAQFRVVVQDSRRTPTSGKIVAQVGTYDPHSKTANLNKERAEHYLSHGAQPSPRVVRLLKAENVKLPAWVRESAKAEGKVRNPDKRRSTRPEEPSEEGTAAEAPAETEAATDEAQSGEPESESAENAKPEKPEAEASEKSETDEASSETDEAKG